MLCQGFGAQNSGSFDWWNAGKDAFAWKANGSSGMVKEKSGESKKEWMGWEACVHKHEEICGGTLLEVREGLWPTLLERPKAAMEEDKRPV